MIGAFTLAAVAVFAATAAGAPFSYSVSGNWLIRNDGHAVSVSDLNQSAGHATWRRVFELPRTNSASDQPPINRSLMELICARDVPNVCYAQVRTAGTDRDMWRAVNLASPATSEPVAELEFAGSIEAIDARSKLALVIVRQSLFPKPGDLRPGLYLWSLDRSFGEARRINQVAPRQAQFFDGLGGLSGVFCVDCVPGKWSAITLDGLSSNLRKGEGGVFEAGRRSVLFAGASDNQMQFGLGVSETPIPDLGESWADGIPLYEPDGGGRPAIQMRDGYHFGDTVVRLSDNKILAVGRASGNAVLVTLCSGVSGSAGVGVQQLNDAADAYVSGGDGHAIVTTYSPGANRRQYLINAEAHGLSHGCDPGHAQLTELPSYIKPSFPDASVEVVRRAAGPADDPIPYVVIRRRGGRGPVMIRAYGAFGVAVSERAELGIEQEWLKRGNAVVIPTLHGDYKFPPWKVDTHGDYQKQAAQDLVAVVEDFPHYPDTARAPVVLLGASAGGFTVARAAMIRPDLFVAAIVASAPLDLGVQFQRDNGLSAREIGAPTGGFPNWFDGHRNVTSCGGVRLFIFTGNADAVVDPAGSLNFVRYAKSLGYTGAYFGVTGDHGLAATASLTEPALSEVDAVLRKKAKCLRNQSQPLKRPSQNP